MKDQINNILFVVNKDNSRANDAVNQAQAWCLKKNINCSCVSLDECTTETFKQDFIECAYDLMCVFGGDGSMLGAVQLVENSNCPILGINFGHLGFLTNPHNEDWMGLFDSAVNNKLKKDIRQCLDVEVIWDSGKKKFTCLNEVALRRHQTGHIIDCSISVNNRVIYDIRCDGVIAASSTGSTAYALSCGGPIMAPSVSGIVICPISPHTLVSRPLIVDINDKITFGFPTLKNVDDLSISLDGKFINNNEKVLSVNVTKSKKSVTILAHSSDDFYSRVGRVFY